jgi:branched-chain amino acid transport system permease protein
MISGLVSGSIYALLGLSIVIIFRATDVINFAIGDMGTFGVYVASTVIAAGVPIPLALVVTMLVSGFMGIGVERLMVRPLGPGRMFAALIVTLGLGLLLMAGMGEIWGYTPRPFPPIIEGTITIFGIALTIQKIMITFLAVAAMLLVAGFFNWSLIGIAMRGSAEDAFAARLVGINSSSIASISWFLGCGLAGTASFLAAADSSVNVTLMSPLLFRAFAGMFLGGLNSMIGTAIGGLMIGILDNLAGRYVSASFRDTIVFLIIVAILFLRPSGILGAKQKGRV